MRQPLQGDVLTTGDDVHSTKELTSDMFSLKVEGREVGIPDLFPGFDDRDRLGIVVREPGGSFGASVLTLATITAFYDIQRQRAEAFFIYADYFVFHVGQQHGNHSMIDIWPDHKEVVVEDDAEALLRAINDRAITCLLVPDGQPGNPTFGRSTVSGGCLRSALAYDASGRVRNADVVAVGNAVSEKYVAAAVGETVQLDEAARASILACREQLIEGGRPVEHYRRIDLETARSLLEPS
ncbi:MAG: hypothetical protein M9890_12550 [Thermomicrobiales bacterium]|nr:hypothetical protein [Thermomicrobiales bacterium]